MKELDIELICAHSPQAKGRVERANQTLQDRLTKELRLQGISSMARANAYLPKFIKDYNARFGVTPRCAESAHRPLQRGEDLDRVRLITSIDPTFEATASKYFKGNGDESREAVKSFSVFISNSARKTIAAYVLVWQLVKTDGRVITSTQSYAEPGILMGDEIPSNPAFKHTQAIEPNAVRCFSWEGPVLQEVNRPLSGVGSIGSDQTVPNQPNDPVAVRARLSKELYEATDVTVSLDGVFFDDGTFIGPNTTGYFERTEALINAKADLLREVADANEKGTVDQAFESITAKSLAPDVVIGATSSPDDYYKYYQKLFASEISNMKRANGTRSLLPHLLKLCNRPRPRLTVLKGS
jgi:hypothetical protein